MKRPAGMSRNKFCKYMKFNRSNLYYKPKGESSLNLKIMEIIDEYYLDHPTTGEKTMTMVLREKDYTVNEKRVRRLMRRMNLMAIYPRKCLSKGGKPKYVHPYLLRDLEITSRNQVWSTDISYISMDGRGRCKDNIWIERFWRTVKQEYVYINPTESAVELR